MSFIITLPLQVKSWQFAGKRISTKGKRPRIFKSEDAKAYAAMIDMLLLPYRIPKPLVGCIQLHLMFILPRPQRLCRKKDPDGLIWGPTGPDWDNAGKSLCDRMTKAGFWEDDRMIVDSRVQKFYAEKATPEKARIQIAAMLLSPLP